MAFVALALLGGVGCFTSNPPPPVETTPGLDASVGLDASMNEPGDAGPLGDDAAPVDATLLDDVSAPVGPFAIGGSVTGLVGTGLVLGLNDGSVFGVSADGAFAFPPSIAAGATYTVSVATQPTGPSQTCTVSAGTGTASAVVTDVVVTCVTSAYSVGGTVVGLMASANAGLVLANGTDTVTVGSNGPFTLPASVPSGAQFDVMVQTDPRITGPDVHRQRRHHGTVGGAAVTSVVVNCATNSYVVGGTVTDLVGSGLVLANGTDTVAVSASGTFTAVQRAGRERRHVRRDDQRQPTTPSQTCTVSSGGGAVVSANVTSVQVDCATNSYAVGGTVTGLTGTGLTLGLQDANGQPALSADSIRVRGAFAFATSVASGARLHGGRSGPAHGSHADVSNHERRIRDDRGHGGRRRGQLPDESVHGRRNGPGPRGDRAPCSPTMAVASRSGCGRGHVVHVHHDRSQRRRVRRRSGYEPDRPLAVLHRGREQGERRQRFRDERHGQLRHQCLRHLWRGDQSGRNRAATDRRNGHHRSDLGNVLVPGPSERHAVHGRGVAATFDPDAVVHW